VPSDLDDRGIPRRGSALQIAYYVNCAADVLTAAVAASGGPASIDWRSPLAAQAFGEYKDREFLKAVSQETLASELGAWWPDSGPRWDALGVAGQTGGVVLVEAKANIPEIADGSPCGSGSSDSQQGSANRDQIAAALDRTRERYEISPDFAAAWMETHCYQYANRLAHLCFFELHGVPSVLAHVYFVNDTTHLPTTARQFDDQRAADRKAMGLADARIDGALAIYLPAVPTAYDRLRALTN
jgi:hypothetical protein